MRTDEVRLSLGVRIEQGVLAKQGTREDIALVLEEAPDFIDETVGRLIERARVLRGDKDCFRLTDDDVVIQIPALPRPTLDELKARYSWIERIERDDSPTEAVTLRLATVLKSDEGLVIGTVYARRLVPKRPILLGIQHRDWLLANQDNPETIPDPKVRAALKDLLGKVYMDFPGLVVVRSDGRRHFPFARQRGKRWGGYWGWAGDGLGRNGRIAVSSK